jgi:hypothetical protein
VQTYDKDWTPSCYNGQAQVLFPGHVKVISGTINVTEQVHNIHEVNATLMSYHGVSGGYLCLDGEPQQGIVKKDWW